MRRVLVLAWGLLALTGCAQTQLEHQTDSFNRASANTIGEQTLLNAVRASLELPMSFTKLQKYTAEGGAKGQLAPISNSIISPKIFGLGPTLNWSAGVDSIDYVDVNISASLASLNKHLQYDAVDRYAIEGVHLSVLAHVFAGYVEVHKEIVLGLRRTKIKQCGTRESSVKATCDELEKLAQELGEGSLSRSKETFKLEGAHDFYYIKNTALSEKDYLKFQEFLYYLRVSGFGTDLVYDETIKKAKNAEGKTEAVKENTPRQGIRFQIPEMDALFTRLDTSIKRLKKDYRAPIKFAFRSPRGVLTHLGALITLQNKAKDSILPTFMTASGKREIVFRVKRGTPPEGNIALRVQGPDRAMYYVESPDPNAEVRDNTLRVLTITAELVNGAISEKDFPAPPSFTVRGIR